MKIIFNRKGFESKNGGSPSPIIDGHPCSIPIPYSHSNLTFGDLKTPHCQFVPQITGGRIKLTDLCHLDPDIDERSLKRKPGWKGAFGQDRQSASHLRNQNVGPGDVFLFFGLFRNFEISPLPRFLGSEQHLIFGWLQVAEVIDLTRDRTSVLRDYPWLIDHPHVQEGWENKSPNVLYLAS